MAVTDPLGDLLTRIRNGQRAKKDSVLSPASKLRLRVLDVLQREGYIRGYSDEQMGPAAASIPARRNSRASATASASPSSRRRVAFSRTRKRVSRTSVAKCSRRCSDEPHR